MTENNFWTLIEKSWEDSPNSNAQREDAVKTTNEDALFNLEQELNGIITENCKNRLSKLNKEELKGFVDIFRDKIDQLDKEEILSKIGYDDGSLYARCFIVGMGEKYYTLIDENPSKAISACGEMFGGEIFCMLDVL